MTGSGYSRGRWTAAAMVGVLIALLAACATGDKRSQSLENTLELYGRTLRWGDIRSAVQFMDPEQRPDGRQLQFELQRFEQVDVAGYHPLSRTPGLDPDSVQQIVEIQIVNRHTAHQRTIRDAQTWRWDETNKRWWLTTGLPRLDRR